MDETEFVLLRVGGGRRHRPRGHERPAYAAAQITGADIKNNTVTGKDLKTASVLGSDLKDGTVQSGDNDIIDNTVSSFDIASDSVDSDEVVDFGLTNQDVGVLFAQVNADGTIANSRGGVTGIKLSGAGTGTYEVDFGRTISACAYTATIGPSSAGSAVGEVYVADRAGTVRRSSSTPTPRPGPRTTSRST